MQVLPLLLWTYSCGQKGFQPRCVLPETSVMHSTLCVAIARKDGDRQPSGFVLWLQAGLAQGNLLLGLSFPADVPATALEAPNAQFQSILKVIHGSILSLSQPRHSVEVL